MITALLTLALAAAPDAPIERLIVSGDLKVELVVGKQRGVEVRGEGVEVVGPKDGVLQLSAIARGEAPRPTVRVLVDGRQLSLEVSRGAQLRASGERLDALTVKAEHTSRVDVAALAVRALTIHASQAARVRARGETVALTATRSAQVVLVGRPKKLAEDVRDAARLTVEP